MKIATVGRILWSAVRRTQDDGVFQLGGFLAYSALLSAFPFMIFLAALAGFFGSANDIQPVMDQLFALTPDAVALTIAPVIRDVLSRQNGGLLTIGIIGAMWVASNGIDALRVALNRAYDVDERRPFWRLIIANFTIVLVGAFAFIVLSVAIVLAPVLLKWLDDLIYMPPGTRVLYDVVRWSITLLVVLVAVVALHRILPGRRLTLSAILPGALFSAILLLSLAGLFSLYLSVVGDYSVTYGSLGGIIATLLFLYFAAVIFVFGAEYNCARLHFIAQRQIDETAAPQDLVVEAKT
ncbi:YihY/virulence factor BrkB family protein [Zavarzinia sp. CC-PAN008]|uniref:YihY/virulence factor BrkB family protein n=1 Tax=Zavarzinia sp. CC-PAN008 TaxID=3243332 RepID=UPI003F7480D0